MISYIKLGGLLAAAVAVAALLWIVNDWRTDAARVPILEQRLADQRATLIEERRMKKEANAASEGYQDEIENLRVTRATAPAFPVRLCRKPAAAGLQLHPAEPGPDGAGPAVGMVSGGGRADLEQGPDIGPELRDLLYRADQVSAQARGLQDDARRKAGPQ